MGVEAETRKADLLLNSLFEAKALGSAWGLHSDTSAESETFAALHKYT